MKKIISASIIASALLISACGGGTQYRDASAAEGSNEWGPREIKTTVNKMVNSLYLYLKNDWKSSALIEVKKIRNNTSEHIDTKILSNEIITSLLKKQIQFVDPSYTQDAIAEMEKGMTGLIDTDYAIPAGELQSPNLYLHGEISENVRFVAGEKHQYLVVTIALKELSTGRLLWQDQNEFLKVSRTSTTSW